MNAIRQWSARLGQGPRDRQALALVRVGLGALLLVSGYHAWIHPELASTWPPRLQSWASEHPWPWMKALLQAAVPYGPTVFQGMTLAQLGAGISLILGLFTPAGAGVAVALGLLGLLAAWHTGSAEQSLALLLILTGVALGWGQAGAAYGLDAWVFRAASAPAGKPAKASKAGGKKPKSKKAAIEAVVTEAKAKKKGKSKSKPF